MSNTSQTFAEGASINRPPLFAGENICDVQKRFTHIVNHLLALGKTFDKEELNIKILKSLNMTWQPKVTVISESKDLTSMNISTLFGKLRITWKT